MPKNIARITTCVVVAFTLVLTQGFLGGTPLFSSDGVAVALTPAEKAAKKAARKAAKKAKKAGQAGSRSADKAARNADKAARNVNKAARNVDKAARNATSTSKTIDDSQYNWNVPDVDLGPHEVPSVEFAEQHTYGEEKNIFRTGGGTDGIGALETTRTGGNAGIFNPQFGDKAVTDSDGIATARGLTLMGSDQSSDRAPDAISVTKEPMAPDVTHDSPMDFKTNAPGSPIGEGQSINHRPPIIIEGTNPRPTLDGVTSQNGLLLQQRTGTSNSALDAPSTNLESKEIPMIKRKFSKKSSPN